MLQLENKTPFEAAIHLFPNAQGIDTLYVSLKATFSLSAETTKIADEQSPIQLGDEYFDDPETSYFNKDNGLAARFRSQTRQGANAFTNLSRYEASIDRSLYRALHELLRLQAARRAVQAAVEGYGALR